MINHYAVEVDFKDGQGEIWMETKILVSDKNIYRLAKVLRKAGREIAKDEICKDIYPEGRWYDTIYLTSDSGFEAIVVGDTRAGDTKGYMYLFCLNSERKRNTFPSIKEIALLLKQVALKQTLSEGEGKAAYPCSHEEMENQLSYFSKVVIRMASVDWEV